MTKAISGKRALIIGAALLAALVVPYIAGAAQFRAGEQPSTAGTETIADDLYIAGGNVNAAASVVGDLVAAGGSLFVSGTVSGDGLIAGGNVTILGSIGDDLRVAGGNIIIHGSVGDDLVAAGGQIQINGTSIGGDVVAAGGLVRVDAPVKGNLRFRGGEIDINAPIGGSVSITADKIVLAPGAMIGGDLTYSAASELTGLPAGQVKGKITYIPRATHPGLGRAVIAFLTIAFLLRFLAFLAAALVIGLFFRRYTRMIIADAYAHPVAALGRGVIFLIAWPVISVILLATLIGIPLGILGILGFAAAVILGCVLAPIFLGSLVHRWIYKPEVLVVSWKTILAGSVLSAILMLIPVAGWLIEAGLFLIALGSALKVKWSAAKEWR